MKEDHIQGANEVNIVITWWIILVYSWYKL